MNDLDLLCDAARAAGRLALALRDQGLKVRGKPDGSPVTNGDLAVDKLLSNTLRAARPDYGWLSEETADDPARLKAERVFMVDPIDGTSAYLKGAPWFVISIAIVEAGRPVSAAIYAPALDELYSAEAGGGARCNGQTIWSGEALTLTDCRMVGDVKQFKSGLWPTPWPQMQVERRNAIAYRMALVAANRFDAAVSMGDKHDWDLAAGDLIAREAGAQVSDTRGRPLIFNTPQAANFGLICASAALFPLILARTAPIDPSSARDS